MTPDPRRRPFAAGLVAAVLALAGCGGGDGAAGAAGSQDATATATAPAATTTTPATSTTPAAGPLQVTSGRTTLDLGEDLRGLLEQGGLRVEPVGAARADAAAYTFPITGGRVALDPISGRVDHEGGLRFVSGDTTLTVRALRADLDEGVLTGTTRGQGRIPVLRLALEQATSSRQGGTAVIEGIRATLTPEAADLIEQRFGIDAPLFVDPVQGGQRVGSLAIRAQEG